MFSWLHINYAHLASVRFEHSVCRGSLTTTYMHVCIYIYIYTYIYNLADYALYIYSNQYISINEHNERVQQQGAIYKLDIPLLCLIIVYLYVDTLM